MTEYPVRLPLKRAPTHPGVLMREIIDETIRLPKTEVARAMGVSRTALYAMLDGKSSVTAEMALRFCGIAGGDPQLFLNMQTANDLWHAERNIGNELKTIRRAAAPAHENIVMEGLGLLDHRKKAVGAQSRNAPTRVAARRAKSA